MLINQYINLKLINYLQLLTIVKHHMDHRKKNLVRYDYASFSPKNFGHTGKAKRFKTSILDIDLEEIRKNINYKSKIDIFISNFIEEHTDDNVQSSDDVLSLILTSAISLGQYDIVKKILTIDPISPLKPEGNILTNTNIIDYSPVTMTMCSGDEKALGIIEEYLDNISSTNIITKTSIAPNDKTNLIEILNYPQFDKNCINKVLDYLYTKECIGELQDLA